MCPTVFLPSSKTVVEMFALVSVCTRAPCRVRNTPVHTLLDVASVNANICVCLRIGSPKIGSVDVMERAYRRFDAEKSICTRIVPFCLRHSTRYNPLYHVFFRPLCCAPVFATNRETIFRWLCLENACNELVTF